MQFDRICRICTSEVADPMQSIYDEFVTDALSAVELVNVLTNISAHRNDGLPEQICSDCLLELVQVAAFKCKTERSDRELKQRHLKLQEDDQTTADAFKKEHDDGFMIKIEFNPVNSTITFLDDVETPQSDCDEKPDDLLPIQSDGDNSSVGVGAGEDSSYAASFEAEQKFVPPKRVKRTYKKKDKLLPNDLCQVSGAGRPYECSACKSRYAMAAELRKHIKDCRPRVENLSSAMVNCFDCEAAFRQVSTLTRHVANLTCIRRQQRRKGPVTRQYHCAHCKKVCQRRDKFLKHLLVHGFSPKFPCSNCDLEFEQDAMKEHVRLQHTELSHLCPVCGKVFALKNTLRAHMLRHNPDKPFKCTVCPFACVAKTELEAHTTKHTGEHPFECDICGHRSTTRSARARHKRIHTGEKKHACDLCPKRFAVAYGLKKHRRTHTGEKPYACDQCDRTFTQRTDWVWHKKHHIEGYQFQCTLCPESFASHSLLKGHRSKAHKGWKLAREAAVAAVAGIVL